MTYSTSPALNSDSTFNNQIADLPHNTDTPLLLASVHNLRDLGGLRNGKGKAIRTNKLFRSGNPGRATTADIKKLKTLDLDLVIDFRSTAEKSIQESHFADTFNWIAMPIQEGNLGISQLIPQLQAATPQDMEEFMQNMYKDFPTKYQATFSQFMKTAELGGTLMYHCTAGKDRTGFATHLLLSALDVDSDTILQNYLESNHWNQQFTLGLQARFGSLGIAPEVTAPLLEVRADYLQASIQYIEKEWGNTKRYINEALDVNTTQLQNNYLEMLLD